MTQNSESPQRPITLYAIERALQIMYDDLYHGKVVLKSCVDECILEALKELEEVAEYAGIPYSKKSMLRWYLEKETK